jgi:hypothetical protein
MTVIERSCEEIDASVFYGDMLFDTDQRKMLKDYIDRWNRAINDHESNMKIYEEADRDQEG